MNPARVLTLLFFLAGAAAQTPPPAPDFALPAPDGRTIRLSPLRNKAVVLEFLLTT